MRGNAHETSRRKILEAPGTSLLLKEHGPWRTAGVSTVTHENLPLPTALNGHEVSALRDSGVQEMHK